MRFLNQKKKGQALTIVGDGNQRRDFTYVKDIVRANILAMRSKEAVGQLFNIGSGKNYSVNEVAKIVAHDYVYIPPRPGESRITLADITKSKKTLKWKPEGNLKKWLE